MEPEHEPVEKRTSKPWKFLYIAYLQCRGFIFLTAPLFCFSGGKKVAHLQSALQRMIPRDAALGQQLELPRQAWIRRQ